MLSFRDLPRVSALIGACVVLGACGGSAGEDTASHAATTASEVGKWVLAAAPVSPFSLSGWYWNPAEGGTGFMFEAQGNRAFVAFFMYEETTGKPIWYAAYGDFVSGAASGGFAFSGDLRVYQGGQAVTSAAYTSPGSTSLGPVSITFAAGRAQVALPGGRTIDAQRYVIDGSGHDFANPVSPKSFQPEVGWYWNPAEGGRGYAIEVQNDKVFMAMFHYNLDGSPTWNIVQGDIASGVAVQAFELYTGGQSLTSGYRAPTQYKLSPFTLSFRNACAGQMQLSGGPAIAVRRFRIDGATRPAGAECNAVSNGVFPATPGLRVGGLAMEPGDSVFGQIKVDGELYAHGFNLRAGRTYTISLEGAATGAGTLANPVLSAYDASLVQLLVAGPFASSVTYTPATSGAYYLTAQANGAGTGSFVLSTSGVANGISTQPSPALASYEGSLSGSFSGRQVGTMTLSVDANGKVGGALVQVRDPGVMLVVAGTVAPGGALSLTATGPPGNMSFTGFLGPQGSLSGTWSDAGGPGGMFVGTRTSAAVQTP